MKIIDWKRVLRTAIQSGAGAVVAFVTVAAGGATEEAIISAGVQFLATVVIAVAMNINKQAKEADHYGDDE